MAEEGGAQQNKVMEVEGGPSPAEEVVQLFSGLQCFFQEELDTREVIMGGWGSARKPPSVSVGVVKPGDPHILPQNIRSTVRELEQTTREIFTVMQGVHQCTTKDRTFQTNTK